MRFPYGSLTALALFALAAKASAEPMPPPPYVVPPTYSYPAAGPAAPTMLPYREGDPIPIGYHPATRYRRGLILGGALTFGITYSVVAVTGAISKEKELLIPFAGPFMGAVHLGATPSIGVEEAFGIGIIILDGLAQTAGAAMLIVGLLQKKQVLVRDEIATTTVRITPLTMGHGGMGIGIVGAM